MRKKLYLGAVAGLALLSVASCSSETPLDEEQNVLQIGDPTYASLNVYINTADTRAGGDDNADAVEQTIKEINFYIFSGNVLERTHKQMVSRKPENIPVPIYT